MSIEVLAPGLLTTIQDRGRFGYRDAGVGVGGALDEYSLQVANALVGNPSGAAALEITLQGPALRLARAARIALCGAAIDARCDGRELPGWRPIDLPAGSELRLGACREGCRSYLAIAGGIDVPLVLGSRGTDLRGGFGGIDGRALRAGDRLAVGDSGESGANGTLDIAPWWIDPTPDLEFARPATIRILPGHDGLADPGALDTIEYRVSAASNRQGLRLEGAPLQVREQRDRVSEPVAPGTLQLPPDGQPIVLLADAQTVGGYPRIAHVVEVDRPKLAQLRPGDRVRFQWTSPESAWRSACQRRQRLARIALAIEQRARDRLRSASPGNSP